jgi:cysteine desulfurase
MSERMSAPGPIYLDHNATTPLDPAVWSAMVPYFTERFGNPSSVEHSYGSEAAKAVERAREQVAQSIAARPGEIIFTGSCTEANNLTILGVARAAEGRRHFVTSQVEHPSVLATFRALEQEGHAVTYVPVDEHGRVDPDAVEGALSGETALVSVMAANNEVGTLQPIREIGARCEARGVLFHSDLAQAMTSTEIQVERDHLHLASLSGHKAYGPKGVGALYVRSRRPRAKLAPIVFGGGQERGLRSGTVNTPLVVGFGEALSVAGKRRKEDSIRLRAACQRLHERLSTEVDGLMLNGHPTERLPNQLSFSIQGVEPLALIRLLRETVSFSASSACATEKVETSHVLRAMFGETWRAQRAFRVAPGRFTSDDEIATAAEALVQGIGRLRGVQASVAR